MSLRMSIAERRAFNDGLQAAMLAICVEDFEESPFCAKVVENTCAGCDKWLGKQKQLIARIKALRYGRSVGDQHQRLLSSQP